MFFLNLTAAEFLSLLGVLGGLVAALYLLDRAKRRKIVSTLRFWTQAGASEERQSRRRMRDPWSLLLQLLSLLLLLLAISRVEWGSAGRRGRDHVVLLDTSSWSAAPGVLAEEKSKVTDYLATLPRNDRVTLVAADALATPLTKSTDNRREWDDALRSAVPSATALDLAAALSFARQAVANASGEAGEVVYAGPGLTTADAASPTIPNLRVLRTTVDRDNLGIRQLSVGQLPEEANAWQALVAVKNYGLSRRSTRLDVQYGGTSFAPRNVTLEPDAERTLEYTFTTRTPGNLTASLTPGGSLPGDDRASVFVPRRERLTVAVFTDRPRVLRPLLEANRQLSAAFYPPAAFGPAIRSDVAVFDRFAPPTTPHIAALYIEPPAQGSPFQLRKSTGPATLNWNRNLHVKPLRLQSAYVLQTASQDTVIASVPDGAVVALKQAAAGQPRVAAVGFDPAAGELRFEVATPLLFAELLQSLNPSSFERSLLVAQPVGLVELPLDASEAKSTLTVADENGLAVPFSRRAGTVEFFMAHPATVHVSSAQRERTVSLRLPAVGDRLWTPPATVRQGIPPRGYFGAPPVDLWKWCALAAALCLLLEWLRFGPSHLLRRRGYARPTAASGGKRSAAPASRVAS